MGTAPDGSIYVLNNEGNQLIKITSPEKIEFLGAVKGYAEIFADNINKQTSFGGDIISDTEGNLYIFTAFGYVVKLDLKTISAEYVGQITGLPEGYTVNGVAVNEDNTIVIASSNGMGIYFTDINSLEASLVAENTTQTYDLASKYLLKTKSEAETPDNESETEDTDSEEETILTDNSYFWSAAYPNPTSTELIIDKTGKSQATTKVLLYSHNSTKLVFSKNYPASTKRIKVDTSKLPNGVYYLNMFENGKKIKEQTIIVQH
jgi:hypothetical protein